MKVGLVDAAFVVAMSSSLFLSRSFRGALVVCLAADWES